MRCWNGAAAVALAHATPEPELSTAHVPSSVADADTAVVIGAGVIGMLTARRLSEAGWRVTVVDRAAAGRESSWAGGGILAPLRPWSYPPQVWELVQRSRALYPELAATLLQHTGVDPQLLTCGASLHDPAQHAQARQWHEAHALPLHSQSEAGREWLDMPWVSQVRNPRFCKALRARLLQVGVSLREQCPVARIAFSGGRVSGVIMADGQVMQASHVVVAAGAWSAEFCDRAPDIRPVRGQMLLLRPVCAQPARIWLLPDAYAISRSDGLVLVGSTVEHVGFDKGVTATARSTLLAQAVAHLPWLADAGLETHWSGLRPGSADGIPIIGADAHRHGLWWNTGHYRAGLAMGPASAERLVQLMQASIGRYRAARGPLPRPLSHEAGEGS